MGSHYNDAEDARREQLLNMSLAKEMNISLEDLERCGDYQIIEDEQGLSTAGGVVKFYDVIPDDIAKKASGIEGPDTVRFSPFTFMDTIEEEGLGQGE